MSMPSSSAYIIITNLKAVEPSMKMTIKEAAGFFGIEHESLYSWYKTHPDGGIRAWYNLSPIYQDADEDLEKFKTLMFSPWGKKFIAEWEKACEPFRRLQRRRDGMTEERYEGLTDMLSAVSWTR